MHRRENPPKQTRTVRAVCQFLIDSNERSSAGQPPLPWGQEHPKFRGVRQGWRRTLRKRSKLSAPPLDPIFSKETPSKIASRLCRVGIVACMAEMRSPKLMHETTHHSHADCVPLIARAAASQATRWQGRTSSCHTAQQTATLHATSQKRSKGEGTMSGAPRSVLQQNQEINQHPCTLHATTCSQAATASCNAPTVLSPSVAGTFSSPRPLARTLYSPHFVSAGSAMFTRAFHAVMHNAHACTRAGHSQRVACQASAHHARCWDGCGRELCVREVAPCESRVDSRDVGRCSRGGCDWGVRLFR
jgi:hypothetical protein